MDRWAFNTGASLFSSPALGEDGTLYFGSLNGSVYALPAGAIPDAGPWAMFRHNARHLGDAATVLLRPRGIDDVGYFIVEFLGRSGTVCYVDASSNLTTWGSLGTVTLSGLSTLVGTELTNGFTQRFYRASSGAVRSVNAAGFWNMPAPAGTNLIANQINAAVNTVAAILPSMPDGTQVVRGSLASTFDGLSMQWDNPNFTLAPGEGAWLFNRSGTTYSFWLMGQVMQGLLRRSVTNNVIASCMVPQGGGLSTVLGWQAQAGDQITLRHSNGLSTYTYDGLGWNPQEPVLAIGEAFIYIGQPRNYDRFFLVWP